MSEYLCFDDKLHHELKQNWKQHRELLINDSYLVHTLLELDLDGFTEFLIENPSKMTEQLFQDIIISYACNFCGDRVYYKLLRILPILVKFDPHAFFLFHKEYKDEQFTKLAFESNPEVEKYFDNVHKIYVSENPIAKLQCSLIRGYKFFKASYL